VLDQQAVGERDDEDGRGRHKGQEDRQVDVVSEGLEGLLGAVRGGRQAVGAEPDPGQESDERDAVEDPRIHRILGLADKDFP
jgi:hypothetical protein